MAGKPFGWCFIGAGSITRRVLRDFPRMQDARVVSVHSKTLSRAQALALEAGAQAYPTLEAAVSAPGVDAVYIATTNDVHSEHTLAALKLGKPVLCEKPFAINHGEAEAMIRAAKDAGLYLMEGMWTRFNPAVDQALSWLRAGRIGAVRTMEAEFSSKTSKTARRVFDPSLGGGGLLDLGVYPLSLAQFVLAQQPDQVVAVGTLLPEGVDSQCGMLLRYPDGAIARLFAGIEISASNDVRIYGETGEIHLPNYPFTKRALLRTAEGEEGFDAHTEGEGFEHEFNAVMADIRAGRLENALVTHRHTLDVMRLMDAVRAQIGLRLPQDGQAG